MSRVLLQSLVFPPDGVSTADVLGRLMLELKQLGHEITVVTTTPHYNLDESARAAQPLHRRAAGAWHRSNYHGISVYHVALPTGRNHFIGRTLAQMWFHAVGLALALGMRRRIDVVLSASPPPTAGFFGAVTARLLRLPFVYNVQEVFPDALEHLGLIRPRGWAARLLARAERYACRRAAAVVAVSSDFTARLSARGAAGRVHVISNFADAERIIPQPRRGLSFAREYDLEESFNITYAGNIGLSQDWVALLDAAAILADQNEIRFVLVGGGVGANTLRRMVADRDLSNIALMPYQSADRVAQIYAASDLCLIPLRADLDFDTLPSKIYSIMASGRPALVYADPDCATARLVTESRCGIVVPRAGGAAALSAHIRDALDRRAELVAMGERGRARVVHDFGAASIAAQYDTLLRGIGRA